MKVFEKCILIFNSYFLDILLSHEQPSTVPSRSNSALPQKSSVLLQGSSVLPQGSSALLQRSSDIPQSISFPAEPGITNVHIFLHGMVGNFLKF